MYRTIGQLDSLTQLLAQFFPQLCTRIQLPESSVQGRPIYALRLRAGDGENRRGVLLVGGTHSRELMNPDLLIELAVDLVVSYLTGNDLVLGGRTWPASDLKLILDTLDLYLLVCMNPDGRHHVMTVDDMWRKNLRDNPNTPCDGVDLNRNLDILWGVTQGQTSCNPCTDVYAGPSAFSEPETRNVKHLLDTYRIDCFADVHSYSELVLYPWDHAPTQTTNPAQVFTTLPSGTCQPIAVPNYQEYMHPPRPAALPDGGPAHRRRDRRGPRAGLHPAGEHRPVPDDRHPQRLRLQPPHRGLLAPQGLRLHPRDRPVGRQRPRLLPPARPGADQGGGGVGAAGPGAAVHLRHRADRVAPARPRGRG
jgi:hypothetical protein